MNVKVLFTMAIPLFFACKVNGQTDESKGSNTSATPLKLKDHILSISPMQFTENGVGFSFSYEKGIDRDGIISFNLPLISTFNLNNNPEKGGKQDAMFYFSPGLKFYPTGSYGKSKYAIGPSLVIGAGEKTSTATNTTFDPNNQTYTYTNYYTTKSKFLLGIMVDNSLNLNPTPHFYLGLNFGFGFTYINTLNGINQGVNGTVQGGFKIGYRF